MFNSLSDLSGMSPSSKNLAVSNMIHQSTIEIDEKGSSASASTILIMSRRRTPTLSFIADQPFLFFIMDDKYNVPLFAGKIFNPTM